MVIFRGENEINHRLATAVESYSIKERLALYCLVIEIVPLHELHAKTLSQRLIMIPGDRHVLYAKKISQSMLLRVIFDKDIDPE